MGAYVNVDGQDKAEWLGKNCVDFYCLNYFPEYTSIHKDDETFPVVLINNGWFSAAAIAYSEKEYKELTNLNDTRPRWIFIVPTDKLKEYSNLESYLK